MSSKKGKSKRESSKDSECVEEEDNLSNPTVFLSWHRCVYNFNCIFIVSGCVTLCLGIWLLVVTGRITELTHHLDSSPCILILYGLAIVIITASSFMYLRRAVPLFMYCGLIVVLYFWGIMIGAYLFLSEYNMEDTVSEDISFHMTNYNREVQPVMDKIQSELECCGNNEPFDWFKTPHGQVPLSCCKTPNCEPTKLDAIYTDGCEDKVRSYIHGNADIIGILIFGSVLIPMVGAVFVFCLGYEILSNPYQ